MVEKMTVKDWSKRSPRRTAALTTSSSSFVGGFLDTHRPINSLSRVNNKRKSNSTVYATASATPPRTNASICLAGECHIHCETKLFFYKNLISDSPQISDRTLNSSSHSGFKGSGSIQSNGMSKLTPISLKLPIGPAAASGVNSATASNASSIITSSPINGRQQDTNGNNDDSGLVIITILPDEQGRFGFNVKGGQDQKMPIIVSRVGANTPADK